MLPTRHSWDYELVRNEANEVESMIPRASLMSLEALLNASALPEYKVHGTPLRFQEPMESEKKGFQRGCGCQLKVHLSCGSAHEKQDVSL